MEKENEKHEHHEHHNVEVSVVYSGTGRTVKFEIAKNATLHELFNEAYVKLGEPKKDTDQYFCLNGTSMTGEMSKTVESVIESKCKEAKFEIRTPSGGAL